MRLRKLIVKGVLFLLVGVALAALTVPFLGGWDALFRILGIGATGVGAALLSIPLAMLTARPVLRPGAIAALLVVAFEAIIISTAALDLGSNVEEFLFIGLSLALPLLLFVASAFLVTRAATRTMARIGFVTAAIASVLSLTASIGELVADARWFERLVVFAQLMSITGLLTLAGTWRRDGERWLQAVLVATVPLAAFVITVMWYPLEWWQRVGVGEQILEPLATLLWAAAGSLTMARLSRLADLRGMQNWLRPAFVLVSLAGSALLAYSAMPGARSAGTLGSAAIVVSVCMLLAMIVLWWLNRRGEVAESSALAVPGSLPCPRCHGTIELRPGAGACAVCGLRYKLALEAPNCRKCRHDLGHITSEHCPECGEKIRNGGGVGVSNGVGAGAGIGVSAAAAPATTTMS